MKKVKLPTIDKKNFPYDLVQVIWEDIVGDAGWAEIPDIKSASTAVCCSIGYLVFKAVSYTHLTLPTRLSV